MRFQFDFFLFVFSGAIPARPGEAGGRVAQGTTGRNGRQEYESNVQFTAASVYIRVAASRSILFHLNIMITS